MIYGFILLILVSTILFLLNREQRKYFYNIIYQKNRLFYYSLIATFILILIILFVIDFINSFAITVHFFIFLFIFNMTFLIIRKITKKNLKNNISSLLAFIITILYLTYGIYSAYNVVESHYTITTKKKINNLKIVQISDSHIGSTLSGEEIAKYTVKINNLHPDIVVITGDYVDDDTKKEDMINSIKNISQIKTKYGIYFIFGNHDKGIFKYRNFSISDLKLELKKNNIITLEDETVQVAENVTLIGRQDRSFKTRANISKLVKNINQDNYIIVLDHQPNDYKNEEKANVDLVLSGHTHGGQLIPIGQLSVLLGFNDSYYGEKITNNTTFIVNSGISDWNLKFKVGAISEYGVIEVKRVS